MTEAELPGLVHGVLWAGFALGALFGAVAQRTHFCTMGAVADIVHMGDWQRMSMWLVAIATAMLGFNALVGAGLVQARHSIYAAPTWLPLSNLAGGLAFGFGMVLASGCGSKTLVRIGGGSLKAVVVFAVLAIAAYATLRGLLAVWRVATIDTIAVPLPAGQDLPSLLAAAGVGPVRTLAPALAVALALALLVFVARRPEARQPDTWLGGIGVGLAVAGGWWATGHLGHVIEHPLTLEETFVGTQAGRMESLTFVAPFAYTVDWLILFSDTNRALTFGIASTAGVVLGSAAVALAQRTFRWEGFAGTEDTANHLVGALLMGVGGVTALGCTIGQGITGLSTLALGSFVALAGIVGGAVLALRYQAWRLERVA
ncbi:MAG: YeeE/YedE family protein [Betaproteobacteria bacterium]|nr:YeeE/YedE family protein [Betaproteobacteria bacterium]MCC6248054.1 YeeE/YedE family protein [Rubrivivax sp.]MCL4699356.1 YeeE/YedE family protein [Burkholderiaceae bacterium]